MGQRLALTDGTIEITTYRGAVIVMQAPCIAVLSSDNTMSLQAGQLIGTCESDRSKGFLVRTPHMDVIDLGTQFGIDATSPDATEVHVFDGEVVASGRGDQMVSPKQRLSAGQAALADSRHLVEIEPDPIRFAVLPFAPETLDAGITRLTGGVAFSMQPPRLIENRYDLPTDKHRAFVFAELSQGHTLKTDIELTIGDTGEFKQFSNISPVTVPAGTTIRSYFVSLNAGLDGGDAEAIGSVSFKGEILGVIAADKQWFPFIERMQEQSGSINLFSYSRVGSGLEGLDSTRGRDVLSISEDRHTLSFSLTGIDFAEIFRVIVRYNLEEDR